MEKHNPKNSFLLGHLAVDGAKLNTKGSTADVEIEHDGEMIKVESNIFKNYRYVFLGHYHNAQTIANNVEYIGSPLQLSFGELEDTKNIIILEVNEDDYITNYIKNTFSPQHFEDTAENLMEMDSELLKNSFISILVDDEEKDQIANKIKLLESKGVKSIKIKKNVLEKSQQNETEQMEIAKDILSQSDTMVKKFVEISITDLDKDLLVQCGFDIINQSQE